MQAHGSRALSPLVLAAFAFAGTAPLALVAVSLASATGLAPRYLVAATALGLALFVAPLAVWLGCLRTVAGDGGLYAFVERAAGPVMARIQGTVWTVSYLLYLPYTVTYIVFYLLPYVLPLPAPWPRVLEVALPVAICLAVALVERVSLYALVVLAALQVAAVALLAGLVWRTPAARPVVVALPPAHLLPAFVGGAAQISLLLVCLSLVVFLGGEAAGGGAGVRRALVLAFAAVCAVTLAGAWLLARGASPAVLAAWIPVLPLAARDAPGGVGTAVGVLALLGIVGVIVAEFVALVRLGGAMVGLDRKNAAALVSAFFIAADLASLANPKRFYTVAIAPSVVALYVSQFVVFAVYPLLGRGAARRSPGPWILAAIAAAWAAFGLYGAVTTGLF